MGWAIHPQARDVAPNPRPSIDEMGLYREALLHSPQHARRLERVLADQRRIIEAFRSVDPTDRNTLLKLSERLRELHRTEAAMLTEIWYEELGGEG